MKRRSDQLALNSPAQLRSVFGLFLGIGLGLTGCGYVSLPTAASLSRLSPLATDPASTAVKLDMPRGVAIRDGSARLHLTASTNGVPFVEETVALEVTNRDTGHGVVLRVAPHDIARLEHAQSLITTAKQTAPDATMGSLQVSLGGCRTMDGPQPDARISVRIQTDPSGPFMPLLKNVPLAEVLATDPSLIPGESDMLPLCTQ